MAVLRKTAQQIAGHTSKRAK